MKALSTILLPVAVALAFSQGAGASPLTVDGNLADWGIQVSDYVSGSDRTPSIFTTASVEAAAHLETFFIEDTDDTAGDGGALGPHSGGQNYDTEFMAAAFKGSRLHLLIVSGIRPDNGLRRYSPGDVRIVGNNGRTWAIEVGGGQGCAQSNNAGACINGTGNSAAIVEGAPGSTFKLDSQGYTSTGTPLLATGAAQTAGSIWEGGAWLKPPFAPFDDVQYTGGGVHRGTADFVFTMDALAAQHSVIELSLDSGIFGDATHLDIYWGPSCNNDVVHVGFDGTYIPEPGSLPLLGLGIAAVAFGRRRGKGQ